MAMNQVISNQTQSDFRKKELGQYGNKMPLRIFSEMVCPRMGWQHRSDMRLNAVVYLIRKDVQDLYTKDNKDFSKEDPIPENQLL